VANWRRESSSCSRVEKNDSAAALFSAEPTRPMDWTTPRERQAPPNRSEVNPGSTPRARSPPPAATSHAGSLARHGVDAIALPGVGHFLILEDPVGFDWVLDGVIEKFMAR
jgi:hypothetical protein